MQSGFIYGFAGQVDGIVRRMFQELPSEPYVVATGWHAEYIYAESETIKQVNPLLTLVGLRLVYERNRPLGAAAWCRENEKGRKLMRVLVLGGAGDMGAETVRDLLGYPEVEQVTIADLNVDAASRLASTLGGGSRVKVRRVDATSPGELVAAITGHTVVAGALGPFYRFEKPVVEAVLQAGVDYVSICDDYDAAGRCSPLIGRQRNRDGG